MKLNTSSGSFSEGEPLTNEPRVTVRPDTALSDHFVAMRDDVKGTIAIMPVGWVGDPALIIHESKLADLKACLAKI